jgi:hypothetical protein
LQEEHIVRILHNVQGQIGLAGMPRLYDLVMTDQRLVGIMKKNLVGAHALGASFGAVGGALAGKSISSATRQMPLYNVGELDDLASAEKTSFSLSWASMEKGKISGIFTKTLGITAGGKTHYLQFSKKVLESLEDDLLSRIPTLKR